MRLHQPDGHERWAARGQILATYTKIDGKCGASDLAAIRSWGWGLSRG